MEPAKKNLDLRRLADGAGVPGSFVNFRSAIASGSGSSPRPSADGSTGVLPSEIIVDKSILRICVFAYITHRTGVREKSYALYLLRCMLLLIGKKNVM